MSKRLALTPLFLFAATLSAQTPATVTVLPAQTVNNCPIGIAVGHTSGATFQQVSPAPPNYSLAYNISLSAFDGRLIRQADVTLHGIIGVHYMPTTPKADTTDATETFTLTQGAIPKPHFQSVVYTQKLTGVQWIQVNEVTYADGTQWHQTPGSVCRVAPNGVILINTTSKALSPKL